VRPSDLIQGTLDVLILKALAREPRHGWAIAKHIQCVSNEVLLIRQGSLYPALHRLEQQGFIQAEWQTSTTGRDAKVYSLTDAGRGQLDTELSQWERLSAAIRLTLQNA
jgi:transcriptional regulator